MLAGMSSRGPTHPSKLREVRALRERGVSITMIAALTGVPRSTVGDLVRGEGETVYEIRCERCGKEAVAFSGKRRFCDGTCARTAWNHEHLAYKRERRRRAQEQAA